jgi:hypothetical protein
MEFAVPFISTYNNTKTVLAFHTDSLSLCLSTDELIKITLQENVSNLSKILKETAENTE